MILFGHHLIDLRKHLIDTVMAQGNIFENSVWQQRVLEVETPVHFVNKKNTR